MTEPLLVTMEEMGRYSCGGWTIECGPGSAWRFVAQPDNTTEVKLPVDLEALAACAHNAASHFRRTRPSA